MMAKLNRYRLFSLALLADLILALFHPALARASVANSLYFAGELALILPAVMVLIGLFDTWVPREFVEKNVGPGSGARGVLLSIFLGTATAGPLYAAYPVAFSLLGKGTRLANIVIFLETWGAIKLSMILLESQFLGLRFALLRLAVTLPGAIGIGFLMEWALTRGTEASGSHDQLSLGRRLPSDHPRARLTADLRLFLRRSFAKRRS